MIELWSNTIAVSFIFSLVIVDEVKRFKMIITPAVFFAAPFLFIVLLTNFLLVYYQYPPISLRVMWFLAIQALIIWLLGRALERYFSRETGNLKALVDRLSEFYARYALFFVGLGLLAALFIIGKAFYLFMSHGSWHYFGHSDYEKIMSQGIIAHLIHLDKISCFFLVLIYRKSKFTFRLLYWLVFLLSFFALALVQIKHHILHLILLMFLLMIITRNGKEQLKSLATGLILIVAVFSSFWVVLAYLSHIEQTSKIMNILAKYFINYLFSGTMNLDLWMQHSYVLPEWSPLVTFRNLFNVLMGNPRIYSNVYYLSMDFSYIAPATISNVATAYGPFFLIGGWPFAVFYSIFIGTLSYLFFYLSLVKSNVFILFMNLILLVYLLFSFFGAYVLFISFYEVPIQLLLIILFVHFVHFMLHPNEEKNLKPISGYSE